MPGVAPTMVVCLWIVTVKDRCMKLRLLSHSEVGCREAHSPHLVTSLGHVRGRVLDRSHASGPLDAPRIGVLAHSCRSGASLPARSAAPTSRADGRVAPKQLRRPHRKHHFFQRRGGGEVGSLDECALRLQLQRVVRPGGGRFGSWLLRLGLRQLQPRVDGSGSFC